MSCFQANSRSQKISEDTASITLPHVRQLSDKSHTMDISYLTGRIQAFEFMNEAHRQVIEKKDAALALVKDDLKNHEHNNVALQA